MSINEVRWLDSCPSTNAYVKEHFEEFGPVGAVYTTNQTAGRGRLGRSWENAAGQALYYTARYASRRRPPGRCWPAWRCAVSCFCATASSARSSGPTTFCWAAKNWPASCARWSATATRTRAGAARSKVLL